MSKEIVDLPPYSEIWKDTQKRTPLSEADVEDRYNNCEYVICYMDYRAGFRDAEKAHGIGGSNE